MNEILGLLQLISRQAENLHLTTTLAIQTLNAHNGRTASLKAKDIETLQEQLHFAGFTAGSEATPHYGDDSTLESDMEDHFAQLEKNQQSGE